ncbi:MAG: ABC transporter ATP-binding protein [Candidatus Kerfeldbacteria bacterium]
MPLIDLQHISKTFKLDTIDVNAVVDVSLSVEKGEFIAIMGQSGSGKTTLMNIIGLLDRPTSGEYKLDGRPVSTAMSDRSQAVLRSEFIGFVFQSFNLLPNLTAFGNVMLPAMYSNHDGRASDRARKLLDQVGLHHRLGARPNQLSGGESQRVAIARALMNDPKVLLADEPTGNLDSKSGQEVVSILENLNKKGMTVLLVTHNNELAQRAHRIVRMKDGRIIT